MGPGDSFNIYLYGNETDDLTRFVNREGMIILPKIGSVQVAGMTYEEAKSSIKQRVASQYIGVSVIVSFGRMRAINLVITGEVSTPGMYSVSALTTVTQALFTVGGVSEIGSLRNIEVKRLGESVIVFDAYDLLLRGDTRNDIRLHNNDVVLVHTVGPQASITGAINRPAIYEIKKGQTIGDLVRMGGGLTKMAYRRKVLLERYEEEAELPTLVNLNLASDEDQSVELVDGDHLRIAQAADYFDNAVVLTGAVTRPGNYAWKEGLQVSDVLHNIESDLAPDVELDIALLSRIANGRLDIEFFSFDLGAAIGKPESANDLMLQPRDEIYVFDIASTNRSTLLSGAISKLRSQVRGGDLPRVVSISGSIREPGDYPLTPGQRISDLVQLAGGFPEDVDFDQFLIARIVNDQFDVVVDQFDAGEATLNPGGAMDPELAPRDRVYFFSLGETERAGALAGLVAELRAKADDDHVQMTVSIGGAVKAPGTYPLTQNATFQSLVDLAGGFQAGVSLDVAEISRQRQRQDDSWDTENFNVKIGSEAQRQSTRLQSGDAINVRRDPHWLLDQMVTLTGEFVFPGNYRIGREENLYSIIQRAGGLTDEAFVGGASFSRLSVRESQRKALQQLRSEILSSTSSKFLTEESSTTDIETADAIMRMLESSTSSGRIVIDLANILVNQGGRYDIMLRDGDTIDIPQKFNVVNVVGQVRRPASYQYQRSLNARDYIALSAGMTARANSRGLYLVK
ncbi:MAG: SLBB domain-containing protein, partial [Gammaproteobacteria bacterium]